MILYFIAGFVVVLFAIILARTATFKNVVIQVDPPKDFEIDEKKIVLDLSNALKIKTVSHINYNETDWSQFKVFMDFLVETFPLVHANLEKETINQYSLLYRWKGSSSNKKPILLMAHYDVVPVEKGTEDKWTWQPFSGAIEDGFVWGRGALDIKCQVIALMEAVEALLKAGYTPDFDIYLAFGHDEEVDGQQGALLIAELLKERGLSFEYVLDEGSLILENFMESMQKPMALIGLCEKGYTDIMLTAESEGGHSSMPPKHTALGVVSEAVTRLEKHQTKMKITKPVKEFLSHLGPEMKFSNRVILANLWLFKPLFIKIFSSLHSGNALLRTTTAATMAEGSQAPNVLSQKASVVVNFRILNGEDIDDLLAHIRKVTRGLNIKIEVLRYNSPSKISSSSAPPYKNLVKTIHQVLPDVLTAPYIMLGASDSRKYENVCENIYRFSPYRLKGEDLNKIHGTNECISLENLKGVVKFYIQLILNS